MKHQLTIEIRSGYTTCAESPGVFCDWMTFQRFHESSCRLFHRRLDDVDGWVARCPECLEAEKQE
jgi:hypothetical protein